MTRIDPYNPPNARVIEQPEIGDPPAHVMAFIEKIDRMHERAERAETPLMARGPREVEQVLKYGGRESYAESKRGFGGNTTPKRAPR